MGDERLVDRHPRLPPEELARRFVPPRRFRQVRFETYRPDPAHPSQADARSGMERFAAGLAEDADGRDGGLRWMRWRRPAAPADRPARYLDGGYGVGKTHLLASLWHAAPEPKAYLTFAELTATIGYSGMEVAIDTYGGHRLIAIDEFELDDVASTLMAVTFLREVISRGVRVAATSNTLPDRLGEGRFAAEDFRREIAAIAEHFDVVRVDGPDYRRNQAHRVETLDAGEAERALDRARAEGMAVSDDDFVDLLVHLRQVHPVQVGAMIEGVEVVALRDLAPMPNQGDALLFVHLVDELYDADIPVVATGCRIDRLFPDAYRGGGYRKKYGRCESRLASLLAEGAALAAARDG